MLTRKSTITDFILVWPDLVRVRVRVRVRVGVRGRGRGRGRLRVRLRVRVHLRLARLEIVAANHNIVPDHGYG